MSINNNLKNSDQDILYAINGELSRQTDSIELIASENYTSKAVMEACGSVMTNKYAEGYPSKRFYDGCEHVDIAENLAIERLKKLFNAKYANVQPHSGSQANQAVFLSLLNPGDTILGMSLDSGGHLTHGAAPNMSGKWFNNIFYGVRKDSFLIDYDEIEEKALEHKPKLIIAGYSAYPRSLDFKKFKQIADKVGAYLLADIAHISGLVAVGEHESPLEYADAVTSTTHKTLRGPRGGIIMTNNEELAKKFNSAVFPGLQGGPLMHIIAGKAVAFGEALSDEFRGYIKDVKSNAKILSKVIIDRGFDVLTNGTDNHMILIDLRSKNLTGKAASLSLDNAGMTCNKNSVPYDITSPFITSGIRIGTPAATTRGFSKDEFIKVGNMICDVLDSNIQENQEKIEREVRLQTLDLCKKFPLYT